MNALPLTERRAISEARLAELRKLARSPDDAERRVAARLLAQIEPELRARHDRLLERQGIAA